RRQLLPARRQLRHRAADRHGAGRAARRRDHPAAAHLRIQRPRRVRRAARFVARDGPGLGRDSTMPADWSFAITRSPGRPPLVSAVSQPDLAASVAWLAEHRDELRRALLHHGCLMIRGLAVGTPEDFAAVRDVLVDQRVPYREKATPRSEYSDGVFSS